jgi:hypothetical protein
MFLPEALRLSFLPRHSRFRLVGLDDELAGEAAHLLDAAHRIGKIAQSVGANGPVSIQGTALLSAPVAFAGARPLVNAAQAYLDCGPALLADEAAPVQFRPEERDQRLAHGAPLLLHGPTASRAIRCTRLSTKNSPGKASAAGAEPA